jgi:hypothetical protein
MTRAKGKEHGGKAGIDGFIPAITLAQAGIDKNLANRARTNAKISNRRFEGQAQQRRAFMLGNAATCYECGHDHSTS